MKTYRQRLDLCEISDVTIASVNVNAKCILGCSYITNVLNQYMYLLITLYFKSSGHANMGQFHLLLAEVHSGSIQAVSTTEFV